MRSFLKVAVGLGVVLGILTSACGVKKYPDVYYHHPMQYDGLTPVGSPAASVTPIPGEYTPPDSTPSGIPHE